MALPCGWIRACLDALAEAPFTALIARQYYEKETAIIDNLRLPLQYLAAVAAHIPNPAL